MPTAAPATQTIEIPSIQTTTISVGVRGIRPLIINRLSEKTLRELLLPSGRKTTAEKAANLKHDPLTEFRASAYMIKDAEAPTLLAIPSSNFKKAMMSAALRIPGVRKTEIGQLVWVHDTLTAVYGIPQLFMAPTRSADINRTPDVRTRVIVPEWAAVITITFMTPVINERSVLNLLAAAGNICGVGDWRPEKGSGTFGQFVLVDVERDETFRHIIAAGGRAAQQAAMDSPVAYDDETEELFGWFEQALKLRGRAA